MEKILDGCALRESWTGVDGSQGSSLTSYDGPGGRWTQTFVDDLGMVLVMDGEFRDGKMVLSGRRSASRGSSTLNRITWQKMADVTLERLPQDGFHRRWRPAGLGIGVFDGFDLRQIP